MNTEHLRQETKPMEKETEEQTLERLTNFYRKYYGNGFEYKDIESLIDMSGLEATKNMMISFAKDYHSERIKQLVPSKEEIRDIARYYQNNSLYQDADYISYQEGFNKCIELLTKG